MKKFINTRMILIMETLYILIFIILGSRINQYSSFTILSMISIVSFVLSVIGMKNKDKLKFLLLIISILEILFTIFIYLLPEGGIAPPIKLFWLLVTKLQN